MKNKTTAVISLAALVCAAVFAFYSLNRYKMPSQTVTPAVEQTPKIKVAVSGYVPYTIAKETLDGAADITMIIPPGTEPHSFEPLPKTVIDIHQNEFFFYISDRMEPWAKKMSNDAGLALDSNMPSPEGDPHIWIDFNNASAMAQNMAMYVAQKYPQKEQELLKNVAGFQHELTMLDRLYGKMLAQCKTRDIYHIGHLAFKRMAQNYNLNFKPLVGATLDQEPSAKDMAEMIKQIKDNNIEYIFTEKAVNPALSQTIADETGAKILLLYPVEHITKEDFDKGVSYRQFMMANLQNLSEGLGCAEAK